MKDEQEKGSNGNFLGLPPGWPRVVAGLGAAGVMASLLVYLVVSLGRNYEAMREQRQEFLEHFGEVKARQAHMERLLERIDARLNRKGD
ncbi:MAG TPA: hypothetical protein VKD72_28095 [Gemmataceae bacterium]|nr:hypothetical protein [Gemmataceae bacterium]